MANNNIQWQNKFTVKNNNNNNNKIEMKDEEEVDKISLLWSFSSIFSLSKKNNNYFDINDSNKIV